MLKISELKSSLGKIVFLVIGCALITACSPKVGSDAWCSAMKEKSKSDWTASELKDFTTHCVFK